MQNQPTVAVVTGAGRGIGRAIALRLAAGGMRVVAVARTAAELGDTAAAAHAAGTVVPVPGDVAEERDVERAARVAGEQGALRVWVNNAAVLTPRPIAEIDLDEWQRTLAVNLTGAFLGVRAAWPHLLRAGGGVIVNVASLSGVPNVEKFPGLAAYNASKAGLLALTESVAVEGREAGIRCVAISPGAVDTAMLRRAAPHLRAGTTTDEVAALVAFLVSDEAALLSGVNIPIFSNR